MATGPGRPPKDQKPDETKDPQAEVPKDPKPDEEAIKPEPVAPPAQNEPQFPPTQLKQKGKWLIINANGVQKLINTDNILEIDQLNGVARPTLQLTYVNGRTKQVFCTIEEWLKIAA